MKARQTVLVSMIVAAVGVMWMGQTPKADAHPNYGCDSCHVPHRAHVNDEGVPLWNPEMTTTSITDSYEDAGSGTLDAVLTGPNGSSVLCLGCHDGVGNDGQMSEANHISAKFGEDGGMGTIQGSHPISFVYDTALAQTDGELVDPASDPDLFIEILDPQGRMQCVSCHDIHLSSANLVYEPNLRWDYTHGPANAAFCRNCHDK